MRARSICATAGRRINHDSSRSRLETRLIYPSIYLSIYRATVEEEEEETVQDLLNGVQLIGRWSIRYEKFPRGISRWGRNSSSTGGGCFDPEERMLGLFLTSKRYRQRDELIRVIAIACTRVWRLVGELSVRISAEGGVRRSLPLVPPEITEWRCIK